MPKISDRQARLLAIIWLITINILFFLPGSALPKQGWLTDIQFDKWVHFGFFTLLVFLWRFYFSSSSKYSWLLVILAAIYGLIVELVQHFFVLNRSCDIGDLIADTAGSLAGIWFWYRRYIKK